MFTYSFCFFFFFKQKTAYEMRISDWSSDVCSSDLKSEEKHRHENHQNPGRCGIAAGYAARMGFGFDRSGSEIRYVADRRRRRKSGKCRWLHSRIQGWAHDGTGGLQVRRRSAERRSEEHTSELQSLLRRSYAVYCMKTKEKCNRQE